MARTSNIQALRRAINDELQIGLLLITKTKPNELRIHYKGMVPGATPAENLAAAREGVQAALKSLDLVGQISGFAPLDQLLWVSIQK